MALPMWKTPQEVELRIVKRIMTPISMDVTRRKHTKQPRGKEKKALHSVSKRKLKPALVAESPILLDVKLWDDKRAMVKLEECARSFVWGSSTLVPRGCIELENLKYSV